jgi:hypothetical protein
MNETLAQFVNKTKQNKKEEHQQSYYEIMEKQKAGKIK